MLFTSKIKSLKKMGVVFTTTKDDTIKVDLKKSNLFSLNYQSGELTNDSIIECNVFTLSEFIESETETIVSCYFDEFERTIKDAFPNSVDIVSAFCDDEKTQYKKAKKMVKENIESRYITRYNCLTEGRNEFLNDKLFLVIL